MLCSSVRASRFVPGPGSSRDRLVGVALALVAAIGFSAKAIFVKLAFAISSVDAITLLALRMGYAAPCYLALLAWSFDRGAPWRRSDLFAVLGLGFLGYYLASVLDFLGLQYISAALERLVLFLYPTLVVVLAAVLLRRHVGRRAWVSLALSYVGIALVVLADLGSTGRPEATLHGCALVFGSAVAYAFYLLGSERSIARLGALRFTAAAMLASSACALVQFALVRPLAALDQPTGVHGLAIAMALVSTVLPTVMLGGAIARIGPGRAAMVGSIGPVATIGLGALVLDEPITAIELAGAALVVVGVVLVGGARPNAQREPSATAS